MKKMIRFMSLLLALVSLPLTVNAGGSPYGGVDHSRKVKSYSGPETCMECHKTSKMGTSLAADVVNSAHFQLRTMALQVDIPGSGIHGMVDRACGLPGSSMMANNYAGFIEGTNQPDGCGKCHIGKKIPFQYATVEEALPDVDCLRCHAYCYGDEWDAGGKCEQFGPNPGNHTRAPEELADGSWSWSQDRSLKTAQSVGNLPLAELCLRCHEHGYTGYKRATPFEAHTDVHAAAQVECFQCHVMEKHKIARGNYVSDGVANDMPEVKQSCSISACHGVEPHAANNAVELNKHIRNVSCEACHVSEVTQPNNIARRSWAPYTLDPITQTWQDTPVQDLGDSLDAYNEYHPDNFWPTLRWFDGKASMLAQPFGGYDTRITKGGCSKIYAFKPFTSGMLFEAGFMNTVPVANDVTETRPYSMKAFFDGMWPLLKGKNLVDAKYATAQDYWNGRPDMAYAMNNMPAMLYFDRKIYLSRAKEIGVPPLGPGPVTRANYSGIAEAIDSGLGQYVMELGGCPPGIDAQTCGKPLWSGSFYGMWVPVNIDPSSPFAYEVGSFISMSHAIKGAAQMGAPCDNCHMSEVEYNGSCNNGAKRIDFARFGYPDKDANGCVDPKYGDIEMPEVIPAVDNIEMQFVLRSKAQKLVIDVHVIDASSNSPLSGVVVTATLAGPLADSSLPQGLTTTTDGKGIASFAYSQPTLAAGDYIITVETLTYNSTTTAVNCNRSITKE